MTPPLSISKPPILSAADEAAALANLFDTVEFDHPVDGVPDDPDTEDD